MYEHITPSLAKHYWLPIGFPINFKILCMTYKVLLGLAPNYVMGLVKRYTPSRTLHSMEQQLLCIPKVKLKKFGEQTFSFVAASLYNSIPSHIKLSPSLDSFKSNLKTYLFKQAFPS